MSYVILTRICLAVFGLSWINSIEWTDVSHIFQGCFSCTAPVRQPWIDMDKNNPLFPNHNTLQWCHNEQGGGSNHRRFDCLLNRFSDTDQGKHKSSASLAFVRGIRRWPEDAPHKGPVSRKMFSFDDVILKTELWLVRTIHQKCSLWGFLLH